MGHGLVFSIFMLSKMAGSQAFHALSRWFSPAACLQLVFAGSALALSSTLVVSSYEATLLAFCAFEGLLGIYWPAIALIRCGAISDSQRASTMAVFRVLLNFLVITVLPLAGGLDEAYAFLLAIMMLLACLVCIGVVKAEEQNNTSVYPTTEQKNARTYHGKHDAAGDDELMAACLPNYLPAHAVAGKAEVQTERPGEEGLIRQQAEKRSPLCTTDLMPEPAAGGARSGTSGNGCYQPTGASFMRRAWEYVGGYEGYKPVERCSDEGARSPLPLSEDEVELLAAKRLSR